MDAFFHDLPRTFFTIDRFVFLYFYETLTAQMAFIRCHKNFEKKN